MTSRTTHLTVAGMALALALTGCGPGPDIDPTPTFSSEAEAFAAAKATYRAYVDALNERRADPTASDPQQFLIEDALSVDIETQRQLNDEGLSIVGSSRVAELHGISASLDRPSVVLSVCLDSSDTRVLDESGVDVTPADRQTRSLIEVGLVHLDGELLIAHSDLIRGETC